MVSPIKVAYNTIMKLTLRSILIFLVIAFIVINIVILLFSSRRPSSGIPVITVTPVPNVLSLTPLPATPTQAIRYTQTNNDSVFNSRIDVRPKLSQSDQYAKGIIIQALPQGQETVYRSGGFKITYVAAYDIFQVEILTTNVDQAETDAVAWFNQKGISKQGVCSLPVMFYPNFYIDQQLKAENIEVPPLAEGC